MGKNRKNVLESPIFASRVKSAKPKLFPEGVLGYFGGPTLALVANSFLSSYFNKYLTDLYGITAWAALFNTLLPIVSVIFVVLGNIFVGRLLDKSKSRAGKARPLILISLLFSLLALLMLFIFTPFADELTARGTQITALIMIAVGYNLWFSIAYPLYFTPHSALVNLSTRSSKDRSLLATLSNACNLAAMGLCTMIIPFFLSFLFKYDMSGGVGTIPVINEATGTIDYYTDLEGGILYDVGASIAAWKVFIIALIIITAIGVILEFYFTRERVTEEYFALQVNKEEKEEKKKTISIKEQWNICRRDRFWIFIVLFFFLYQFGGMIKNVSQLYYCTAWFMDANGNYTTSTGGTFSGTLAIIGAVPTALGMVIAWPLSNKIGKVKAIIVGGLVSVIGGLIGFLVPIVPENSKFLITAISFAVKALGTTPAMYLSIALLGDVLDHQEALYGKRTDGLSMTIYGAIMAGMTGIVTGLLNAVLSISGYTPNNPEVIQNAMLWIFVGGETICYLIIVILFIFMKVEKFTKFDQKAIVEDQKAKCLKLGIPYVSSQERLEQEEKDTNQKSKEACIEELRTKCQKKNLDFDAELAKYNAELMKKEQELDAKKQKVEQIKEKKKALKEEKFNSLSNHKKALIEAKKVRKEEKNKLNEEKTLKEFNELRERTKEERLANLELN